MNCPYYDWETCESKDCCECDFYGEKLENAEEYDWDKDPWEKEGNETSKKLYLLLGKELKLEQFMEASELIRKLEYERIMQGYNVGIK